ncbi:hypothetical protein [Sphingomonas adhaesiva]|uniref:hypothetical protein n=1 Tax=Sphingomonas adhaesiva TaxID=28212 RepID=UPI002FF767F3
MPHPHPRVVVDALYPIERPTPAKPVAVEKLAPPPRPICFEPIAPEPRIRPWVEPEESHLIEALMLWAPICFVWYVICGILIAIVRGWL